MRRRRLPLVCNGPKGIQTVVRACRRNRADGELRRSHQRGSAAWLLLWCCCALLAPPVHADPPAVPAGFRPFTPRQPFRSSAALSQEELLDQLRLPTWVSAVPATADPLEVRPPWHHPAITELVGRCTADAQARTTLLPVLRGLLLQPGSATEQRFNAAVTLAWLKDSSGFAELDRVFVDADARPEKRTAAIFALATQPARLDIRSLRTLVDAWLPARPAGAASASRALDLPQTAGPAPGRGTARLRQPDELVAGTLWAVVRAGQGQEGDTATAIDPLLERAARGGVLIRRVVAVAFAGQTWSTPPTVLSALLRDPHPQVRQTALAAIAVRPHAAISPPIVAATHDTDLAVRLEAIHLLSSCAPDAAAARLQEVMAGKSTAERAAAIAAAARLRLWALVERGAGDEAHSVRTAAALALGDMPGANALEMLRQLLADRSTQVQGAAVDALARRSPLESGAGLLEALDSPTLQTRQRAWELLAARWPAAAAFPIYGSPAERSERLNDLRRQWRSQAGAALAPPLRTSGAGGFADDIADRAAPETMPFANTPGPAEIARLVTDWYRCASDERLELAQQLVALGPAAVPIVEEFLAARETFPDRELVQRVLAELDPAYRAIGLLWEPAAAGSSALPAMFRELQQRRLTPMQATVIAERLRGAVDGATWLALVDRLERDAVAEAAALDAVALARPEAASRLDACKRISQRAEPHHAGLLARLFDDPNLAVRRAALRAAGRTHDPAVTAALRQAMLTPDTRTRLAAAASLCALGDAEAAAEVGRLTAHADPQIRRVAIDEVVQGRLLDGASAVRVFRTALDDPRIEIRRLAVAGLEQRATARAARSSTGAGETLPEQIAGWKRLLDGNLPSPLAN